MTKIIVYVKVTDRWRHLYGLLTRKILPRGWRAYIAAADEAEAEKIDRYLWTAAPGEFLPHARAEDEAAAETPAIVGVGEPAADFRADALIWWQSPVPEFLGRFGCLIDIAEDRPAQLQAARERYRFYVSHGYAVDVHDMGKK